MYAMEVVHMHENIWYQPVHALIWTYIFKQAFIHSCNRGSNHSRIIHIYMCALFMKWKHQHRYTHVHMHFHICKCIQIHIHKISDKHTNHMHEHTYMYTRNKQIWTHAHMHTDISAMHPHTHKHTCTNSTNVRMYNHTRAHTHIHIHTHICSCIHRLPYACTNAHTRLVSVDGHVRCWLLCLSIVFSPKYADVYIECLTLIPLHLFV